MSPSKILHVSGRRRADCLNVSFAALLRSSGTSSLIVQSLGSTDSTIHRLGTYTDMQGGLFMMESVGGGYMYLITCKGDHV